MINAYFVITAATNGNVICNCFPLSIKHKKYCLEYIISVYVHFAKLLLLFDRQPHKQKTYIPAGYEIRDMSHRPVTNVEPTSHILPQIIQKYIN
jgi:hypothetical protein